MSLETVCFSMYSDMSSRTSDRSLAKMCVASAYSPQESSAKPAVVPRVQVFYHRSMQPQLQSVCIASACSEMSL